MIVVIHFHAIANEHLLYLLLCISHSMITFNIHNILILPFKLILFKSCFMFYMYVELSSMNLAALYILQII